MTNINNASISYFTNEDEIDALLHMYDKLYRLSLDNENIMIIFVDLTEKLDTITIFDLANKIKYQSYSEYTDYSLLEL